MSEIDLNGQVVKLTDFDLPEEEVVVKVCSVLLFILGS